MSLSNTQQLFCDSVVGQRSIFHFLWVKERWESDRERRERRECRRDGETVEQEDAGLGILKEGAK